VLADTSGILLAAIVTAANEPDRAASPTLLPQARRVAPTIRHIGLNRGYTGHLVAGAASRAGVSIDTVSGPKPTARFQLRPRRWVVEPTNGWINHCRRLDRHAETTLTAHTTRPQPIVRHA
jgi:transposase